LRKFSLPLAAAAILVAPAAADAAVRTGVDTRGGLRLTLDGRVLTAKIADLSTHRDPSLEEQLYGKRIDGICSPRLRSRKELQVRTRVWPAGARSLSFRFRRDISRRVKWCLIEKRARDIAFVTFIRREPARLVGKSRGPSGDWWRLGGWRGWLAEPCVLLRITGASTPHCFEEFVDREVTLGVEHWAPCETDVYFFGVASLAASTVRLTLADGTTLDANLYDRAPGSRVRARFFAAALAPGTLVRSVQALSETGEPLGFRRVGDYSEEFCR
jgi:hypothetical protein